MSVHRDGRHPLATWARRPFVYTATVTVLGAACIALSLAVPLGIAFLALAIVGATAVVAGVTTMLVLVCGRMLGLMRRSDAILEQLHDQDPLQEIDPAAESTAAPASTPEGEEVLVVDLRSGERHSTAA